MKCGLGSVCAVAAALLPISTTAQEERLTLEGALQRAREGAVAIVAARSRVEEARARLRGARAIRDNPVLEGAVGRRSPSGSRADLDVGLSQKIELGGLRGGRIQAAEAGVLRQEADSDDAVVRTLRDVARAFLEAVAARERVGFARTTADFAADVHRIAERRFEAGDVAALELNLAAGALARARSEARAAEAAEALALGELKALVGVEPESALALEADLEPEPLPELSSMLEAALTRPDVRALEAELREAEAERSAAGGLRWPELTPAVRYERDEGVNVLWGGLTLSLPLWSRGQEARGVGDARSTRLRAELEALRRTARLEVLSAYDASRLLRAARDELAVAAAGLEENEVLARRSYEVGQIGLADWLLVRRETVEARLLHLARRLEAAQAGIELRARAGALR
jgi:cobalt-zinc-cadmium efflux system outer membrane protein